MEEILDEEMLRHIPSPERMDWIIWNLKEGKAPGPDGITNGDIKATGQNWRRSFRNMVITCLHTGYFPKVLRVAAVKMLMKSNKPKDQSKSYRPVSLADTLGKIIERIIGDWFDDQIEYYAPKMDRQAGFEKGRGTLEPVTKLTIDAQSGFRKNASTIAVFFDF